MNVSRPDGVGLCQLLHPSADVHADVARIRANLQRCDFQLVAVTVEVCLQRQHAGKVFERRHKAVEVGQRDFRRLDAANHLQRRHHNMVVAELVVGFDVA